MQLLTDLLPKTADLTELGRTPVTVISSGCKSFLDIPRTLEYLETEGVCVGTFADGREGSVDFPAFFTRDSGFRSPRVIQNEAEAAAIVCRFLKVLIIAVSHTNSSARRPIQASCFLGNPLRQPGPIGSIRFQAGNGSCDRRGYSSRRCRGISRK